MRKTIRNIYFFVTVCCGGYLTAQQIVINPNERYQEWIGIGGTVYTNTPWGEEVYEELINEIGYTVFRKHLEPKKQEVHADEALVAQAIADANGEEIYHIVVLWSPDPEFKIGPYNSTCGETDGRYCGGTLDPDKYEEFAQWFGDQVQYYIDRGVNLYGVSLQNEPWLKTNYLSCTYTPAQYLAMFRAVAPVIKARFPGIKIFGAEQGFALGNSNNWIAPDIAEDTIEAYIDAYSYHGSFPGAYWSQYTEEISPLPGGPMSNAYRERYLATLPGENGHKSQWQTEKNHVSDWLVKGDLGEWTWSNSTRTFQEAGCIMSFIREMHGEVWTHYRFDEVFNVPSRKAVWTHYGKFVQPGSRVIASGHDPSQDVSSVAFHDVVNKRLTVVLINSSAVSATIQLADNNISTQGQWYMSDIANFWVDKGTASEGGDITLNAHSISTIYFDNYSPDISGATYPLNNYFPIEDIEILPASSYIDLGAQQTATIKYTPVNTSEKEVEWISSNPDILSVSPDGTLEAKSVGTVDLIANSTVNSLVGDTVQLTVVIINDAPVMDIPEDLILSENPGEQVVQLTGIHDGDTNMTQAISIEASSDNPALIPDPMVTYTSPDQVGSLTFTPAPSGGGKAIITLVISDDGGVDYEGVNSDTITFTVTITVPVKSIPGRIEAEEYSSITGEVVTSDSEDGDGTLYVGWFNQNEELFYDVEVAQGGTYTVDFRTATLQDNCKLTLKSGTSELVQVNIPVTSGWTTFSTVSAEVTLNSGVQTISVLQDGSGSFNINWLEFKFKGVNSLKVYNGLDKSIQLFPNPVSSDQLFIRFSDQYYYSKAVLTLTDLSGRVLISSTLTVQQQNKVDLHSIEPGMYNMSILIDGSVINKRLMIE